MTGSTLTAQEARQKLYEAVRKDTSFEEKAREALDVGEQYLHVENGHLTRIDRETDHWEAVVSTDSPDGRFPPGLELDLGTTYCRRTIESSSPIELHDAPNQGWADDPAFEAHGIHCYHGTTLVLEGEPYGTVCFVAEEPRGERFGDDETMFAELLARLLERELERKRYEDELTRQTNLVTVLNRVLRHNLRNDLSVVRGYTQLMAEKLDNDPYSDIALTNIDSLIGLSQKARELDRIAVGDFERKSTEIASLVEGVVETVTQQHPCASISVEYDEDVTAPIMSSFTQALEELIENAAKHSGTNPTVTVTVELVPNAVTIQVTDNGPGLADHEADVLETGAETPLIHGSGLGLWLAHWIVTSHDGSIDATVSEDGTTMSISVPRAAAANAQQQLAKLTRARDQYQAVFEEARDAMVILDDDARIVDANSEAASIYGMDRQQLLGQPLPRFLPEKFDFDSAWREFQAVEAERNTVTVVGADDEERSIEYAATSDILPGQHLIISREVTDR